MISAVSLSLTLRSLLSSRNTSSACIMYVQYTQVCKKVLLLCNKVCHRFDLSQSFNKASAVTLQDLGCLPHPINTHSAGSFCMYRDVLKSDSCLSESFIRLATLSVRARNINCFIICCIGPDKTPYIFSTGTASIACKIDQCLKPSRCDLE